MRGDAMALKRPLPVGLGMLTGFIVLGVALFMFAFAARAAAQEAPPPDDPPAATGADDGTVAATIDNAGRIDSSGSTMTSTYRESTSEDSSTSVTIGRRPEGDLPGLVAPANTGGNVAGRWRLTAIDGGDSCNITLQGVAWGNGFRANVPAGCPADFFDVTRWTLADGRMEMSTSFGKSIASFGQSGRSRFDGVRTRDGARFSLTR